MTVHRVLSVASEAYPLVKTGGLADVVGALPAALAAEGVELLTLLPGYPGVLRALERAELVHQYQELQGGPARLLRGQAQGLELLVIDAPHLYGRPGNPYLGPDGRDWPDNALRFAALGAVAADVGLARVDGIVPDVVHAHDWQAALAPVLLHYAEGPRPATVLTVHNLAFQGVFPAALRETIGLPAHAFTMHGVEYYGSIGYLKGGLALADRVTTVSPTYAAEIRSSEMGMGLDGLLRQRGAAVSGILNGIDTEVWNPAADPHLAATFDAKRLPQRRLNKALLQRKLGLAQNPSALLFGVVSRLTGQKGMDLVLEALPAIEAQGAQLALIGTGDAALERAFATAAAQRPGLVGAFLGYDEPLAHLLQGGSDALLVPSRFEPCGLTQLCALRYGSIPVVARVGGLADTVVDANEMALASRAGTGIVFSPVTTDALAFAIERTAALWRQRPRWLALQRRAMATDVSWARPAARYAALYRDLLAQRAT